jgi:2-methylaconitate cis-trans-isomerase PrpF
MTNLKTRAGLAEVCSCAAAPRAGRSSRPATCRPTSPTRDRVLLAVMGSPDKRQIDGLGGAHPLTSKVGIVSRSSKPGVDLDFLFAQLQPDKDTVDTTPNCGNMLAAVVPFALETGMVARRATPPRCAC